MRRNASNDPVRRRGPSRAAFSFIELLIVVVIVSVVAGVVIVRSESTSQYQLQRGAELVAADLNYARELAVSNGSKYKVQFDLTNHRYSLVHSGSNASLDVLPPSVFSKSNRSDTRQTQQLNELPGISTDLSLHHLQLVSTTSETYGMGSDDSVPDHVEFTAMGATTEPSDTKIWLKSGSGSSARFIALQVSAASGLVSVGSIQSSGPFDPTTIETDPVSSDTDPTTYESDTYFGPGSSGSTDSDTTDTGGYSSDDMGGDSGATTSSDSSSSYTDGYGGSYDPS